MHQQPNGQIIGHKSKFKGLRLTAERRPTRVCVGLGRVHVQLSGAYWALGPMWSMLGIFWAHVEPMLAYVVGPMLAYVGPMLAYVEPSWRLCWAFVGDMLAILGLR